MGEMDDVVRTFVIETSEGLKKVEADLLSFEKEPSDLSKISDLFRVLHSIKGNSGFLGFTRLQQLGHAGEDVLGLVRSKTIEMTPTIVNLMLKVVDAITLMIARVDATGKEGNLDNSALIADLKAIKEGSAREQPTAQPVQESPHEEPAKPAVEPAQKKSAPEPQQAAPAPVAKHTSFDSTIRINVGLLDKLMNLVGELVLTRNQILQLSASADAEHLATFQRLNVVTTELQEGVMKTRMQPISSVWDKIPRMVRDTAAAAGKRVRVEMEGKDTELDKSVIESITDPLTHMIRNSIDHGIEPPEVRIAAGKPPEGCIHLSASHEGGQLNIRLSDDGAGIDRDRVRAKAIERGLLTPDQALTMNDHDVMNLIFLPGLSTAEKVTNLSGRGVGMDVVKTNIERIGGTIDIQSEHGAGTTFTLKIPLTLLIVPALIVTTAGARYAIPQISLLELIRIDNDSQQPIEYVHNAPVFRLRGVLLPIVFLNKELHPDRPYEINPDEPMNIAVLQAGSRNFGLVVDEINDTQEIVVKPLAPQLRGIRTFAGATTMGDGRVALIVDVLGLAQKSGIVSELQERGTLGDETSAGGRKDDAQPLLVFESPDDGRMLVGLSSIDRLEFFPRSMVEYTGKRAVIQYRGEIMPLLEVSNLLEERRTEIRNRKAELLDDELIQVIVVNHLGAKLGLVVDRVLDIVRVPMGKTGQASRPGVLKTVIAQERVMEMVDIDGLLEISGIEIQPVGGL